MEQNCRTLMIKIMRIIELVVAVLLVIAIVTALLFTIKDTLKLTLDGAFSLDAVMNACLMIVIGVEFVKMLILHTPESVMEVLLFVVARYVVMSHSGSLEILFGMISIALIFFIRKYLFDKTNKEEME